MKKLSELNIRINRVLQAIERIENQHKPYTNGEKMEKLDKIKIKLFSEMAENKYDICENCYQVLFNPSYPDTFYVYYEYSESDVQEIEAKVNTFNEKHDSFLEIDKNDFSLAYCDSCGTNLAGARYKILGFSHDKTNN